MAGVKIYSFGGRVGDLLGICFLLTKRKAPYPLKYKEYKAFLIRCCYLCEIYYYDNGYLIVEYDENENSYLRKVPEAYDAVFAGIMEKAIEAMDSWNTYYSEW